MNSIKSTVISLPLLAVAALFAGDAAASTIPATAGNPYHGVDTCFTESDAGVKSNCTSAAWFVIPVIWNDAFTHSVTANFSSGVQCWYWEIDAAGNPVTTGNGIALATTANITPGLGHYGKVQCLVNAGRWVYGVNIV